MKLVVDQMLPVSPRVAWPHLTVPRLMSRWSTAPILSLRPGDGGRAGGVGALREVRLALPFTPGALRIREVVEHAEPGDRFVYRVFDTPPIRDHRGELRLTEAGSHTHLRWSVRADFPVPGLGAGLSRVLGRELRQSLSQLEQLLRSDPTEASATTARALEPLAPEPLEPLYEEADRIHREQIALCERLDAAKDPKRWFAHAYEGVTRIQLRSCRAGRFTHTAWVLHAIPLFHEYYAVNLGRYEGTLPGEPESHWRDAFRAAERLGESRGVSIFRGLRRGARAHIEEDLPRTLARVYVDHYRGLCDYARFRADYVLMAGTFPEASAGVIARVPARRIPWHLRAILAVMPDEIQDAYARRRFYDLPKARMAAFERGARIAAMLPQRSRP